MISNRTEQRREFAARNALAVRPLGKEVAGSLRGTLTFGQDPKSLAIIGRDNLGCEEIHHTAGIEQEQRLG